MTTDSGKEEKEVESDGVGDYSLEQDQGYHLEFKLLVDLRLLHAS